MPTLEELRANVERAKTAPPGARYDPVYENTINTIHQGIAGLESGKELSTRRVNEDFDVASRDLAQNQTQKSSGLQHRMANQGIVRSGINVGQMGIQARDYQQDVGELEQGKARSIEDIQRDITTKAGEYQNQLSSAEIDRAGRQTQYELEQANDTASALAQKTFADEQRVWMTDITNRILQATQPVASPTGQLSLPPSPQQVVQQAIAQSPPPAAPGPNQIPANRNQVMEVQQILNQQGAFKGDPNGLKVDGLVGPKTLQALNYYRSLYQLPPVSKVTVGDLEMIKTQTPLSRAIPNGVI